MNSFATKWRPTELMAEAFARLLDWLAPDPEDAGKKYEQIRRAEHF